MKVFSVKQIIRISTVSVLSFMPSLVMASPQKVVTKDGKNYAVQDKSGQNTSRVFCNNMEVGVMAHKMADSSPEVMATIVIKSGSQKNAFRLFNVAKDELTSQHDISLMQLGCLTRKGGVGVNIPHLTSYELGLKIQIDSKGRVFLGYDEVGLELISTQDK